jgi:Zn-dependent protease with chaperone function
MHGLLLTVTLFSAIGLRCVWRWSMTDRKSSGCGSWNQRWIGTMFSFLLPPLLLLTSAVALVFMGPHGMGISHWEGVGTYGLAIAFLVVAVGLGVVLWVEARRSIDRLRQYPLRVWDELGLTARLLPLDLPFIAQVGLWNPEIVMSQGMLAQLDADHLRAVIAHEQAHAMYHDTFWFFCFGGLRRLTGWLPQTEALWHELLLLRELRADRVAAQRTDSLLLAEALVVLVRSPMVGRDWMATLNPEVLGDRVEERIEAILDAEPLLPIPGWQVAAIVFAGLLPLAIVPFHY